MDNYQDLFQGSANAKRADALSALLKKHRALYYNGTPEIPDEEFDAYVDELTEIDKDHPTLKDVGAPPPSDGDGWTTAKHKIAMSSLDKVNTWDEMRAWMQKRITRYFCVEEKMDGFSVSCEYSHGSLVRVITRGGGVEGEDITRNAVKMRGIHRRLRTRFTGVLRAEIMFLRPEFEAYNKMAASTPGMTVFKNMRNGASGLARRQTGGGQEYLRAFFYDIVDDYQTWDSRFEMMMYIRKRLGLWTPWFARVKADGLVRVYKEYSEGKRKNLPYEIDGLVIKVDSVQDAKDVEAALQESTRATANPKSQVAWKFASETRVTTLLAVESDFGLGGRVTPVARVAPVSIGGVTVERASLHNWDMVDDMDLRVGGKVLLARSNDVIPQILKALNDKGSPIVRPTDCPVCRASLETQGKFLVCVNHACHGVISGNIRKWIKNLEIDFFGMAMIHQLVEAGKLKTVADLYRLDENEVADICGKGMARRALSNLTSKKVIPLHMVLGSLNITSFGRSLAKLLVKAGYDTVDKVLDAKISDFASVDKFGVGRATQVWNGLRAMETVVRDLDGLITIQSPSATTGSGTLAGKAVCITGSLSQPKKVYQEMIEKAGGEWHSSLKSSTDYLVAADPDGGSSKLKKARKRGTPIFDEDGLLKLLKG